MDDRAPVGSGLHACYFAHRSGILAACDEKSTDLDQARVASLIEEGPKVTTAIVVVEISANVYAVQPRTSFASRYFAYLKYERLVVAAGVAR